VTSFVSGPDSTTLPMFIYSMIRNGVTPEMNALATIMMGVVMVTLISATLLLPKYVKRNVKYKKA
jgi:putrescine transport system permease protein